MLNLNNQGWRDQAACRGMDTDMFFHQVGASVHVKEALKVCNGSGERPPCPVRMECGEFALAFQKEEDIAGVFGGMTPAERNRIRKQRRQTVVEIGVAKDVPPRSVIAPTDPELYSRRLARLLHLVHDVMMYDADGNRRRARQSRPNPATS